ncbi:MAG: SGNH/GDSL hydrolase family protein [Verrucomicrobiota bacterium]
MKLIRILIGLGSVASTLVLQSTSAALLDNLHPLPAPKPNGLLLKQGDRLAICGDSITEQKMYGRIIEDYLTACLPQMRIKVRQYGWGGETAGGFLNRMTNDCLRFKPTIATTCYGMNDHGYVPYRPDIGANYSQNSRAVVTAFKAHGVRVVLGSPGCVGERKWWKEESTSAALNQNLCELRNLGIGIAKDENIGFADVFWPMMQASVTGIEKYGPQYAVAGGDAVHPGWAGHTIMAYAFLKALGISGDIADFRVDLQSKKIKVSAGHKLLKSGDGGFTIRSERYPFCPGAPMGLAADWYPTTGTETLTNSDNIRSAMTLVPFNEELNRFMLTATNGTVSKYRVHWGKDSAVFSAEQLARGINLAAEFQNNPFATRFALIDSAVARKQDFETRQIKVLFRSSKERATMQDHIAQTETVLAETEELHEALEEVIEESYAPVVYRLKITPE